MAKDQERDPVIEESRRLFEQTFRVALDNLHLAACCIDADLLNDECKQKRLAHIEMMTTMIAKHVPSYLAARIACEDCRRAVVEKIRELIIQ